MISFNVDKEAPKPDKIRHSLQTQVGSYQLTANLEADHIEVKAYSESLGEMFMTILHSTDLGEVEQTLFGDCEGVFAMMEECVQEKRDVLLNDVGEVKFPYVFSGGKKGQVERVLALTLKQVEVDEK